MWARSLLAVCRWRSRSGGSARFSEHFIQLLTRKKPSAQNHRRDFACVGDALRWIAIEQNHIRAIALQNCAAILSPEKLGGIRRSCLQRFERSEPGINKQLQLPVKARAHEDVT